MFDYDYFGDLLRRLVIRSNTPLQVEFHPGDGCNIYKCKFCYGKDQELTKSDELTTEEYYKILNDLHGIVDLIHLSGIKSDPLNNNKIYNIIKGIKEIGFRLGISTKGIFLTHQLSNLLSANATQGDFITFGIDASNETIYNSIHGIQKDSCHLSTIWKNIWYLNEQKKIINSAININVSYLLFKENSSFEQMERFIQLFGEISDLVRFSMPQLPNETRNKPNFYLDSLDEVRANFELLKEKYPDLNLVFLGFDDPAHDTTFRYCYAQRFLAVIDHCGYVYPCPQIATKEFLKIAYGNIRSKSFWEIWDSENRRCILEMDVDKMDCRICDRKDERINIELSKLFRDKCVS
jgi:radical SAM protein with 4Fe4S-binding SPASM domain